MGMRSIFIFAVALLAGCQFIGVHQQPATAPELASWIGKSWEDAMKTLSGADRLTAHSPNPGAQPTAITFGNVGLYISATGKIDHVEAFAINTLSPHFSTVAGTIAPG